MEIAQRHLVPRIAEESGLAELGNVFTPAALRLLIREYTREAGVREMARLIGKVYRRLARMKVEGKTLPRRVGPRSLAPLVGPAPFLSARLASEPQIGVSLGLAYTGAGGDVLRIECVVTPGKGDFHLTGQLGEVMQESVTAAWGYLKTSLVRDPVMSDLWGDSPGRAYLLDNYQQPDADDTGPGRPAGDARSLGDTRSVVGRLVDTGVQDTGFRPEAPAGESEPPQPSDHELLSGLEVRMHFPEGGVPKEGPSAGIAVATALLSALLQVPVLPKVALSGEITLTGQILPVGGLKEKLLAALREGVRTVVLPTTVAPEVEELQAELKKGLDIVYVDSFIDVLPLAFAGLQAQGPGEQEGTEL
jgi:ATP-dependent Lon protease